MPPPRAHPFIEFHLFPLSFPSIVLLTFPPPMDSKVMLESISIGLTSARSRSLALALSTMLPCPPRPPPRPPPPGLGPKELIGWIELSSLSWVFFRWIWTGGWGGEGGVERGSSHRNKRRRNEGEKFTGYIFIDIVADATSQERHEFCRPGSGDHRQSPRRTHDVYERNDHYPQV